MRGENDQLRDNYEYLNRRMKEIKLEKQEEIELYKELRVKLEAKLQNYEDKIKQLYEELIKIKKGSTKNDCPS